MSATNLKSESSYNEAKAPKLAAIPDVPKALPEEPADTKNKSWMVYAKVLLGILVLAVCFVFVKSMLFNFLFLETTDDAQIAAHLTVLNTKVGGIVSIVYFGDNAQVKKGDILFAMDTREYQNSIKQLVAEVSAATAKYWYAAGEYKRAELEAEKNGYPGAYLESLKAQHSENLALVWAKQAQLDQAKLNLEFTQVKAPADGKIGKMQIEPGFVIKPQQTVTTFVDYRDRWVVANFKETQLQNLRIGQHVEIEVDAIQDKIFSGHVESIAPGSGSSFSLIPADNATGNFTKIVQRVAVKIELEPESIRGFETLLVPGISAVVKVRVRPDKNPQ